MRIIAIGHQALMDGFALLGVETHVDLNEQGVDKLLTGLIRSRQRALVYLQQNLVDMDLPVIKKLRGEGGDILISVIPDILSADGYQAPVDQLISRVLGQNMSVGG
jgi:vacuolar-type H+-ATPase subunit F/Vma7